MTNISCCQVGTKNTTKIESKDRFIRFMSIEFINNKKKN